MTHKGYKKLTKVSSRFKNVKLWFDKMQDDSRRFKKVHEDLNRLLQVKKDPRSFKTVQEGLKMVIKGSNRVK